MEAARSDSYGGEDGSLDAFLALSRVLTGEPNLDRELARQYLTRLRREFGDPVAALLGAFESLAVRAADLPNAVQREILSHENHGPVARQVTILWFTSATEKIAPDGITTFAFGTPEQYVRGLVWDAIDAHPMALTGGYFGYWHYSPEN